MPNRVLKTSEMWRINKFPENEDSDQSISEDDDLNGDDCVSLGVPAENKGEVQVLSQLEMLRDTHEVIHESKQTSLFRKRHADFCVEDDVEVPFFANEGDFTRLPNEASACMSDDEIICDDEVTGNGYSGKCFTSEADDFEKRGPSSSWDTKKGEKCSCLAANAEADALVMLNCSLSHPGSAKAKRSCKGDQRHPRPRFSFRTHSYTEDLKHVNNLYDSDISYKGNDIDESKQYAMPAELAVVHDNNSTSMVELLGCFQDKNGPLEGSTAKYKRANERRTHFAVRSSIPALGHRNTNDDPDSVDNSSSAEDEDYHRNLELIVPEPKQKTMVDQFQEAFAATSESDERHMFAAPRHTGFGLFAKLQRLMENEKERDSNFLNKLHREDEASSVDVKVLSRSLEAKLSVCSCSSIEDDEERSTSNRERGEHHFVYIFLPDLTYPYRRMGS